MPKSMQQIEVKLAEPTPVDEIRFLARVVDQEAKRALALPYYDARFVQQRLDDVVGSFGWQTKIEEVRGFVCVGLGILNPESGQWVWKWDTGQEDQSEATEASDNTDEGIGGAKAIVSRGLKRAAVQWGIGRDVYSMPKRWRPCNLKQGKGGKMVFAGWARGEETAPALAVPEQSSHPARPSNGAAQKEASVAFTEMAGKHKPERGIIAEVITANQDEDGKTNWVGALADLEKRVGG